MGGAPQHFFFFLKSRSPPIDPYTIHADRQIFGLKEFNFPCCQLSINVHWHRTNLWTCGLSQTGVSEARLCDMDNAI